MAFLAAIALFVGGCEALQSFLPGGDDQQPEVVEPVGESPTAEVPNNTPGGTENPEIAESEETVPPPPTVVTPGGLIQSTNPQQRIGEITQGREDPFASIPVQPIIEVEPGEPETNNQPVSPVAPAPGNTQSAGNNRGAGAADRIDRARDTVSRSTRVPSPLTTPPPTTTQAPQTPSNGSSTTPRTPSNGSSTTPKTPSNGGSTTPKTPSNGGDNGDTPVAVAPPSEPSFIPELPPPPQPDLAEAVAVTGVVQVGGVPQAIVKAPNEKFSRYVRAGQYLSNGQVLVKRIDMNDGPEPVVILEEKGIEVAKTVGAPATGDLPSDTSPSASKASIVGSLSERENRSFERFTKKLG
ncbi:hypothetical protein [Oscillatoria salina]|uniref:hypothetical protein n=1 Tax=Oscillatoria salina TaxID=331517 RepID=UPI001CCF6466|nr:hypothetical protein [Oscillatoria salina]MBZ8181572.1 hypothetical protein [Oscillatoria salina IIICB1]